MGALSRADEAIYWTENSSSHGRIQRMDLSTGAVQTLRFAEGELPTGLAVDPQAGFVFWGDDLRHAIFRARLDGSDVRQLANSNSPRALDVDVETQVLYWSDGGGGAISRIDYDGGHGETIIDALIPNGVAFDARTEHLYWSDLSRRWIGRADADGSNPAVLLQNLNSPGRLRLDPWRDRLMWTNGVGDFQEYSLSTGETLTISQGAGFVRPFDVAIDRLYWLDSLNGGVYQSALNGSDPELLYGDQFYRQRDVRWVPEPGTLTLLFLMVILSGRRVA